MRDFVYNEEEMNAGKNELTKLATDKKKQFVSIGRGFELTPSRTLLKENEQSWTQ